MDLIEQPDTVKEAPGGRDAVSLEGETRLCGELPCAGLLDAFCSSLSSELNASTETVRAYRADVSDYLRWCARYEIPPLGATHCHVRRYLAYLDQARYARRTANRHLSSI